MHFGRKPLISREVGMEGGIGGVGKLVMKMKN